MRVLAPVLAVLLAAGCLAAGEDPREPAAAGDHAADPAPGPASPALTPFAWEGSTAGAACAPAMCQIVVEPASSWTQLETFGAPGVLLRARGTLTWEPASPLTQELRLFVFATVPDAPPTDGVEIRGPSPLVFDVDLAALEGSSSYAFSIHGHHEAAGFIAETPQPFSIAGELVSLVS